MESVPTTSEILQIADISQYLAAINIVSKNFYNNQVIDKRLPRLIYIEKKAVQWAYALNPSDPTLYSTAKYLYDLCAPFYQKALSIIDAATQIPPIVTGPANQSVLVGDSATFSVSVTSALSVTYQWYLNGTLVSGATNPTFSINNAQLTDSGDTVYVRVSNSSGPTTSSTAILTVTEQLTGQFYWGDTDYSGALNAGVDNVPYNGTFNISTGQPLSVQFPSGAALNKYIVIKYPSSEGIKTVYSNPPSNNGVIPGLAFDSIKTITTFNYAFSRSGNSFSQNTLNPVILS